MSAEDAYLALLPPACAPHGPWCPSAATRQLQDWLRDLDDPAYDPGPSDGWYGHRTWTAVRAFQAGRLGLGDDADGIWDDFTRRVTAAAFAHPPADNGTGVVPIVAASRSLPGAVAFTPAGHSLPGTPLASRDVWALHPDGTRRPVTDAEHVALGGWPATVALPAAVVEAIPVRRDDDPARALEDRDVHRRLKAEG